MRYLGAAEQRLHAKKQLVQVGGLDHVVVHPRAKTALFACKVIPRGQEKYRYICVELAYCPGEFKAVYLRHHDVGNYEVYQSAPVHDVIGLGRAQTAHGLVAVLIQIGAYCLIQLPVILNHEQLEHSRTLLSLV